MCDVYWITSKSWDDGGSGKQIEDVFGAFQQGQEKRRDDDAYWLG